MKDILGREIEPGEIVIGMAIGKYSTGMSVGVFNGKSVDYCNKTSLCSNLYRIKHPTEDELEIKQQILDRLSREKQQTLARVKEKKELKRIPKKDLVIGGFYEDDTGRQFYYLGEGTVEKKSNCWQSRPIKSEGYIFFSFCRYSKKPQYQIAKTNRKIVKKLIPEKELDLDNLSFVEQNWREEFKVSINLKRSVDE